jgi:hypothetical protein
MKHKRSSFRDQQVRQAKQREELGRVLCQASVTGLAVTEQVRHDMKGMLNLGTDTGFGLLDLPQQSPQWCIAQCPTLARTQRDMPSDGGALVLFALFNTLVAGITKCGRRFAMQQRMRLGHIRHVGRAGDEGMGDPRVSINADVCLHPKVPFVAFLGLVHLRVTFATLILRRGRCSNDRPVDDRAFLEQQTFQRQMRVDGSEDALSQTMGLQQTAELEQCRGIGCRLPVKVNADKPTDRLTIVEGIFDPFV